MGLLVVGRQRQRCCALTQGKSPPQSHQAPSAQELRIITTVGDFLAGESLRRELRRRWSGGGGVAHKYAAVWFMVMCSHQPSVERARPECSTSQHPITISTLSLASAPCMWVAGACESYKLYLYDINQSLCPSSHHPEAPTTPHQDEFGGIR